MTYCNRKDYKKCTSSRKTNSYIICGNSGITCNFQEPQIIKHVDYKTWKSILSGEVCKWQEQHLDFFAKGECGYVSIGDFLIIKHKDMNGVAHEDYVCPNCGKRIQIVCDLDHYKYFRDFRFGNGDQ